MLHRQLQVGVVEEADGPASGLHRASRKREGDGEQCYADHTGTSRQVHVIVMPLPTLTPTHRNI